MPDTGKANRLVLILEGVALLTALVLILVDYKLKNDLVTLYRKMETSIAEARQYLGENFGAGIDTSNLSGGSLVRDAASMETAANPNLGEANGKAPRAPKTTSPKRSGGVRNPTIPQPDKPV
jgi:hypothetical protein